MSIERARQSRRTMPAPEARLWNALRALRPLGHHFRSQVQLGPYYADFACHRSLLVIEVDGWTHDRPARDANRDAFISDEGYRVLRVTNEDVMRNLDGVVEAILVHLTPHP